MTSKIVAVIEIPFVASNPRTELASDIISTALQCDGVECPTGMVDAVDPDDPIVITIAHSREVQVGN